MWINSTPVKVMSLGTESLRLKQTLEILLQKEPIKALEIKLGTRKCMIVWEIFSILLNVSVLETCFLVNLKLMTLLAGLEKRFQVKRLL